MAVPKYFRIIYNYKVIELLPGIHDPIYFSLYKNNQMYNFTLNHFYLNICFVLISNFIY